MSCLVSRRGRPERQEACTQIPAAGRRGRGAARKAHQGDIGAPSYSKCTR
jgi:hypothetical protein